MMRRLDAFPRFLLKLPFFVRLSVAILSVVFFLLLYMMVSPAARTPLMLAIPMALVVIGLLVSLLRDSLDVVDAARLQSTRALEQQQQLNRAKDQFILNVNHELRTPLTAIAGFIELLLEYNERLDVEARIKFLKQAMDSCDDLQMLIGNVLDALQIDSEKEHPSLQAFSVLQAIREVLEYTDPRWLHSHRVHLDISEELVAVANEQYFCQVLRNLLSNAFKYTPADTDVLVSAGPCDNAAQPSDSGSQVCIKVKDAGPGIPPDELSSLFNQFVRLKRDISGQVRGSGLGLFISKQMVEAMGGRIWAESAGIPGQGSCFCFTLAAQVPQTLMNSSLREEILQ